MVNRYQNASLIALVVLPFFLILHSSWAYSPSFRSRSTPHQKERVKQTFLSKANRSSVILIDGMYSCLEFFGLDDEICTRQITNSIVKYFSQYPILSRYLVIFEWYVLVENVRGKSGFSLSHTDILHSTSIWANHYGFQQQTSLVVDHGSIPSGYHLKKEGLSVVFAGSKLKADDVIVRDISFFQKLLHRPSLVIVTADNELILRCKRASSSSSVKESEKEPLITAWHNHSKANNIGKK